MLSKIQNFISSYQNRFLSVRHVLVEHFSHTGMHFYSWNFFCFLIERCTLNGFAAEATDLLNYSKSDAHILCGKVLTFTPLSELSS